MQYNHATFTQAAKDICRGAWDISRIAVTLTKHSEAATTPLIKVSIQLALKACSNELYTVHGETEMVANRVKLAANVVFGQDHQFGQQLQDGAHYDTRYNGHPFPWGAPWVPPYPKLPGE